jgi:DTW domain-containing protein YfiP
VILQHPRERDVPVGTARLAELALRNVERHVGVEFSSSSAVTRAVTDPDAPAILLFPSDGARDLLSDAPETPVTLVVIDGTWSQATKVLKINPHLARLPRYCLRPAKPSRYRIRREPAPECMSTIEAIAAALGALERDQAPMNALLAPFDVLVEQQLRFARERGERRHIHHRSSRGAPTPRLPALLAERPLDIVVAYGEANAWPKGTPLGAHPEIVHWAAERVVSGERFEAFISPRHPLSPSFTHHTGLEPKLVEQGDSWDEFVLRWQAFLRPSDVLCGWGLFSSQALKAQGAPVPERFDIRLAARHYLRKKLGEVQGCAAALGENVETPWVAGRTGIRLAALTAVARSLVRAAAMSPSAQ